MNDEAREHERYRGLDADILFHDTWADDDEDAETCPRCRRDVASSDLVCRECGARLHRCAGSCSSCGSPRCVGDKRRR